MNRKLLILNVILLAVVAFAGVQLRKAWKASKAREAASLNRPLKPLPPPPIAPLPAENPVEAVQVSESCGEHAVRPVAQPDGSG